MSTRHVSVNRAAWNAEAPKRAEQARRLFGSEEHFWTMDDPRIRARLPASAAAYPRDVRTAARLRPPGPRLSPLAGLRAFRRDPIGLLERAAAFGEVA